MRFINLGAYWSQINGYDYYRSGRVLKVTKLNDKEYESFVEGSKDNIYNVIINPEHPRKSTCTCPRAYGKRVICKHMIATYLTVFPEVAEEIKAEREAYEREREEYWDRKEKLHEQRSKEVLEYIETLSLEELKNELYGYKMAELESYDEDEDDEYYYY